MQKIDVFTHILPEKYLDALASKTDGRGTEALNARRRLSDLDIRFRIMELNEGYAQILNNETVRSKGLPEASMAFGEFWFNSDSIGSHAINAFLYKDTATGPVLVGFFEPQNGQILTLTKNEIHSCSLLRL